MLSLPILTNYFYLSYLYFHFLFPFSFSISLFCSLFHLWFSLEYFTPCLPFCFTSPSYSFSLYFISLFSIFISYFIFSSPTVVPSHLGSQFILGNLGNRASKVSKFERQVPGFFFYFRTRITLGLVFSHFIFL